MGCRNGVSLRRLGASVDPVAVPINDPHLLSKHLLFTFNRDDILGPDYEMPLGQDVLFLGYPLGFHDTFNNLPIVRRGLWFRMSSRSWCRSPSRHSGRGVPGRLRCPSRSRGAGDASVGDVGDQVRLSPAALAAVAQSCVRTAMTSKAWSKDSRTVTLPAAFWRIWSNASPSMPGNVATAGDDP